jgi:hypothetical protein
MLSKTPHSSLLAKNYSRLLPLLRQSNLRSLPHFRGTIEYLKPLFIRQVQTAQFLVLESGVPGTYLGRSNPILISLPLRVLASILAIFCILVSTRLSLANDQFI